MPKMTMIDHQPQARYHLERIGDTDYKLEDTKLDVFDDVTLWHRNPRLIPFMAKKPAETEDELEAYLQGTKGYDGLQRNIASIGQQDAVYVWRATEADKYLVLEGATRVTILRDLVRRGGPGSEARRMVKAKILPPEFPAEHRTILLAKIHVRGESVRSWGRYIEAKFVFDNTFDANDPDTRNGREGVLSMSDMAKWMGKSVSWVSRLRFAYKFAQQYRDFLDSDDADQKAADNFSTLEEIAKSAGFGPLLKGENEEAEQLRADVFDMVTKDVFKEYRDARHMKAFYDDPEKWERLKTHEKWVANELASEVRRAGPSTVQGKIQGLHAQIERALEKNSDALSLDDLEELQKCVDLLASQIAADLGPFRIKLQTFAKALEDVSLAEIRRVTPEEYEVLTTGLEDFSMRYERSGAGRRQELSGAV